MDTSQANPTLPAGNPFNVSAIPFWSATTNAVNSSFARVVNFFNGNVTNLGKTAITLVVWCVRGTGEWDTNARADNKRIGKADHQSELALGSVIW